MECDKKFYGQIFLGKEDLDKNDSNYKMEIEYYKIENNRKINIIKSNSKLYGVEIVKTEYLNEEKLNMESKRMDFITKSEEKVEQIIEILKRNKVTPVSLEEVICDLKAHYKLAW